jgi:hypothetical protein
MAVNNFMHSSDGSLDATGADHFAVGADLTIEAGQAGGNYTGTFDVTVAYY